MKEKCGPISLIPVVTCVSCFSHLQSRGLQGGERGHEQRGGQEDEQQAGRAHDAMRGDRRWEGEEEEETRGAEHAQRARRPWWFGGGIHDSPPERSWQMDSWRGRRMKERQGWRKRSKGHDHLQEVKSVVNIVQTFSSLQDTNKRQSCSVLTAGWVSDIQVCIQVCICHSCDFMCPFQWILGFKYHLTQAVIIVYLNGTFIYFQASFSGLSVLQVFFLLLPDVLHSTEDENQRSSGSCSSGEETQSATSQNVSQEIFKRFRFRVCVSINSVCAAYLKKCFLAKSCECLHIFSYSDLKILP